MLSRNELSCELTTLIISAQTGQVFSPTTRDPPVSCTQLLLLALAAWRLCTYPG
jgi:hypothetical protein